MDLRLWSHKFCASNRKVQIADASMLTIASIGRVKIDIFGILEDVLHIPKLCINLIYVQKLAKLLEYSIIFYNNECFLINKWPNQKTRLARIIKGLYQLQGTWTVACLEALPNNKGIYESWSNCLLLHKRLGHPSILVLKTLFPTLKIPHPLPLCEVCENAKHKKSTYPSSLTRKSYPFQLIHSDVWGHSQEVSIHDHRWFIVLVDDCTRFTWAFLTKTKSEVSQIISYLIKFVQQHFDTKVKGFRTDNARDFDNHVFKSFFSLEGIIHETSCVYTPQQNGVFERKIGHISEKARALPLDCKVPVALWSEAVLTATQLINRLPTPSCEDDSPQNRLQKFYPSVTLKNNLLLGIFGFICFIHNNKIGLSKCESRSIKCVFIGYSNTQKGYKCYSPELKKIFISKDVTFHENIMYYSPAHDDNVNFFNKNSIESEVTNIPSSNEPCETLSQDTTEINENDNVTQAIGRNVTVDNLAQE